MAQLPKSPSENTTASSAMAAGWQTDAPARRDAIETASLARSCGCAGVWWLANKVTRTAYGHGSETGSPAG